MVAHRHMDLPERLEPLAAGSTAPSPRNVRSVPPSMPSPSSVSQPATADGAWLTQHVVQMLCAALTIPSVSTSVNQRSTDLSVRLGLAGLSASALQGVPCACPATSQPMATRLKVF